MSKKQLYEINKARRIPRNEYASSLISDISGFEKELDEIEVLELVQQLDEDSQKIIFKRFYESKTTKEIGKENGYGRETARRRIIEAVDKLKQLCLPS